MELNISVTSIIELLIIVLLGLQWFTQIAVLKFKYIHRSWLALDRKSTWQSPPEFRTAKIKIVSMAKKLFSGTKRCDGECQKSEPIVYLILSSRGVSWMKSFFVSYFLRFKNSEFINSPCTCNLKRFLLQHTNLLSLLDFSFFYSVMLNI